jgi:peptidyl-dipeptidase Dcp
MSNPLLDKWSTPYATPPFHLFETGHYLPAAEEAIRSASEEINAITENKETPTFENTVAALDSCGEQLTRIAAVLFNLNNAETTAELQAAAQAVSPLLTRFSNDITLNEKLFARIKAVYDSRESLNLSTEQKMLLDKKYRDFLLGGAGLLAEKRARFREISEELSRLTLKFEENVLDDTNSFELHIEDPSDLEGLPDDLMEMAEAESGKRGKKGWIFTLNYPSYLPFMQYAENRKLRETMHKAYGSRAYHGDRTDNRQLVSLIVNLRLEIAKMLGFRNFAEMVLGDRMAENPSKVFSFLEELSGPSKKAAIKDFGELKAFALANGHTGDIERWDWAFWSEKLKKARYNIDDEILKPYFRLERVQEAVFGLATRLYGLKFSENTSIPVYQSEVTTWEVHDEDNRLLALLYLDFHPRKGKNGGAWMTSYRDQKKVYGRNIIPLISIVTNFTRPTETKPSLLTFNEFTTLLHEFGHALHGMLSQCTYESLAGTNVARDFVELPSQFMENWTFEQEWLDTWAVHFKTGEKIPAEMIRMIKEASTFNEGYACTRQLGFAFLDMAWHTVTDPFGNDVAGFEASATERSELFPKAESTNMSCSFTHLFGGGYAAGYYGYKWAEVLDADAFKFFQESGLFNREVANSFRRNILEKGGSDKPMNLYTKFRGKEPSIGAFLERSGLK